MAVNVNEQTAFILARQIRELGEGRRQALYNSPTVKRQKSPLSKIDLTGRNLSATRLLRETLSPAEGVSSGVERATLSNARIAYLLRRMHELSISATNTLLSVPERNDLDKDFQALRSEIERIINTKRPGARRVADSASSSVAGKKKKPGLPDVFTLKTLFSGIRTRAMAKNIYESITQTLNYIEISDNPLSARAGVDISLSDINDDSRN